VIHAAILAVMLTATAGDAVALREDTPAPFSGVLLQDDRFAALLLAEVKADQAEQQKMIDARYIERLESQLDRRMRDPKWYEQSGFQRWVGFGVGVLVTSLAIQMGVIIVNAQ